WYRRAWWPAASSSWAASLWSRVSERAWTRAASRRDASPLQGLLFELARQDLVEQEPAAQDECDQEDELAQGGERYRSRRRRLVGVGAAVEARRGHAGVVHRAHRRSHGDGGQQAMQETARMKGEPQRGGSRRHGNGDRDAHQCHVPLDISGETD